MFLCFVSESPNSTRIQTHHLRIGHVILIEYKIANYTTKERKMKEKMGSQNLLQCIYRVVHVYPSLVLIIFQFFSGSRVCMALC